MPSLFGRSRNAELSTISYIETQIAANWSDVTVVKGYPNFTPDMKLPIVAVTLDQEITDLLEIGSRQTDDIYNFSIDIFGKSNANRLDLAQFLKDKILLDWTYNEYSRGSGESIVATPTGKVVFIEFNSNERVDFSDDVSNFDRFRHLLSFNCRVVT